MHVQLKTNTGQRSTQPEPGSRQSTDARLGTYKYRSGNRGMGSTILRSHQPRPAIGIVRSARVAKISSMRTLTIGTHPKCVQTPEDR